MTPKAKIPKISEAKIEAKLVKFCREHRIYTRKFASPSNRGVPDRIFGKDGKILFMELKRPGNSPTTLQMHEGKTLLNHNLPWVWCDSYDAATTKLREFFYLHQSPVENPNEFI